MKKIILVLLVVLTCSGFGRFAEVKAIEPLVVFDVVVPMSLPVSVGSDGIVSVSKNMYIENNSDYFVSINDVSIVSNGSFNLIDYSNDFRHMKVDSNQFGLKLNGNVMNCGDSINLGTIVPWGELSLDYDMKFSAFSKCVEIGVCDIVFTVSKSVYN